MAPLMLPHDASRAVDVPLSDLRDWREVPTHDAIELRLWNHRRVIVGRIVVARYLARMECR
jgi:hypothetical protein